MGILGLTHNKSGASLQKLPVVVKVAIGLGPDPKAGRKAPSRLDHFIFCRKEIRDTEVVIDGKKQTVPKVFWTEDPEITKAFAKNPIEVGVIFLDDDPENVFKTSLAWWGATECLCSGNIVPIDDKGNFGMTAIRKTKAHPEGEPWPGNYRWQEGAKKGQACEPCGDGCPDLEEGRCKPSGDLYFILAQFPMLGAICRLHTTSYRSIRNIANAIQQIRGVTGGRLAGMTVTLRVEPERISYESDSGKRTTTAFILSIRMDAPSMAKLIDNMTETRKLFAQTQQLLGGRSIEIVEDDEERAPEIAEEFHPENAKQRQLTADAGTTAGEVVESEKKDEPVNMPPRAVIPDFTQRREVQLQGKTEESTPRVTERSAEGASAAPSNDKPKSERKKTLF